MTTTAIAAVLDRAAVYTTAPVNASLNEALHTAARGNHTHAAQAAELLARILRRHTRDLGWWDRSHTRSYVAATLAATATAVTR